MRLARRFRVASMLPFLVASLAAGCGGGGGGGGDPTPDTTAPTVTATSPLDGAEGVATSAAITVTFSEAMSGSSLSTSTFLVARGTTPVLGTVSPGSSTATFHPSSPLYHSTTYTATITTGARDAAGNPLEQSRTWSFTTADPPPPPSGWNAQAIGSARDDFDYDIYGVDVDLNEGGTGIAVWEEAWDSSPSAGGVWVAWYRGGWEAAERLTDVAVAAVLPRVALNDAGDAIVVYQVSDLDQNDWPRSSTVWARRWVDGAWGAPERLCEAPAGDGELYATQPRVGIDAQGRAIVAWDQTDVSLPRPHSILGARFDGTSWSAPFLVSGGELYAAWADAAVSADGSAVVVWEQETDALSGNVWARVFDGAAWGDPQRIGPAGLVDYEWATRARAVMDAAGRAFVVFEESRTDGNRIGAARFDPAGPGWTAPATLASSAAPTDHLSFPSIATDGSGNAFAVWQSDVPAGSDSHGAAARFDAAGGAWDAATFFETGGNVLEAVSAMDGAAKGWALFTRGGLKARRNDPELGWQDASSLGSGYASDAEANGSGMVIVGAHDWYYATTAFLVQARAAVYVP